MKAKYRIFEGLSKRNRVVKKLILLFICLGVVLHTMAQTPASFLAGAAEAKINPANDVFLAGYQHNRKSSGIHDDLFAKALVVSKGEEAIAIVTIDCIGLPYPLVEQIRDLVEHQIPQGDFNAGRIVVASTHTHAAPDVIGLWGEHAGQSGVDSVYNRHLVQVAADAVVAAWKKRVLATARYASASFGADWVENISDKNEVDREVSILQFVNRRGKSIGSLVNFACHPTFLDKENTEVSADFPAGLYRQLKSDLGGVNLYLQGAIGGWIQPENVERTFDAAIKKGIELGQVVATALQSATPLQEGAIRFASRLFEVPVSNQHFRDLAAAKVINRDIGEGVLTEIVWFSIGEATFVTHPGESSPLYSLESKKLMQNKGPKFVIGLGMDELGYLLKPEFFEPGTTLHAAPYLTSMSPGRDAGRAMMRLIVELAEDSQYESAAE